MAEDAPGIGDNVIDASKLKSFVERIEALEEEKRTIAEDIKNVYDEAKDAAFDKVALKLLIKRRKEDPKVVSATDEVLDAYERSLRRYLKSIGVK